MHLQPGRSPRTEMLALGGTTMPIRTGIISAALFSLLAAGCAGAPSRPTPQITRAQTLIEQAEKAGAQQYAPTDLDHARDRLSAANEAAEKGKQAIADQYASEAAADAELATARASAG